RERPVARPATINRLAGPTGLTSLGPVVRAALIYFRGNARTAHDRSRCTRRGAGRAGTGRAGSRRAIARRTLREYTRTGHAGGGRRDRATSAQQRRRGRALGPRH